MGSWLRAWLSYYRQLYQVGAIIFVFAALAALMSFLFAAIPASLLGWVAGWEISDRDIAITGALIFFPAVLGGAMRYASGAHSSLPKRPPYRWEWKLGIRRDY